MTNEQAFAAPLTILAVDDDADALRATERILREAGFHVATGATAAEALELTHHHHPALVLLDVMLPDGSGVDVARQLKSDPALADVFVILFSGTKVSSDDQAKGLAEGLADGYMVRPLRKPELLARIEAFLRIRETQRALRESEQSYRLLADHSTDVVWLSDMDMRITYQSPSGERLRGYTTQELHDLPLEKNLTPESLKAVLDLLHAEMPRIAADPGYDPVITLELEYYRKDGSTFWSESKFSVIRDAGGRPVSILGEGRDITERRQAREALRASDERHRAILRTTLDGFWLTDAAGRLLEVNEAYCRMSGYSEAELLGMRASDLEVEETAADVAARMQKIVTQGEDRFESRHRRKDGSLFDVEISVSYQAAGGGRFAGFLRDVTEQREVEAQARASAAMYRRIVETAREGIWAMDAEYRTTFVNQQMAAMLGYEVDEMLGRVVTDFMFEEDLATQGDSMRRRSRLQLGSSQTRLRRKDGVEVWALLSFAADPGPEGEFVGSFGMFTDVTERKQAEDALRKSEERYCRLFETMSEGVVLIAPDGRFISANPAAESILGLAGSQIADLDHDSSQWGLLGSDGTPLPAKEMAALQQGHAVKDVVMGFVGRDGTDSWISVNAAPLLDAAGAPEGVVVSFADVTARKRAEEALRESEEIHKEMIASVSDVIAIMDVDGKLRYTSPNIERYFGWRSEDLVGIDGWETVHPDDLERTQGDLIALVESGDSVKTVERRYKCRDGSYKWIELTATNLTHNPLIHGLLMNYHDISERKAAEEDGEAQREILQSILDHIPVMVTYFDATGKMVMVSREVVELLGWTLEEWQTGNVVEKCYPDPEVCKGVFDFMVSGSTEWKDWQTITKHGTVIDTAWTNISLADGVSMGIGQDVSARKRAEQDLLESLAVQETITEGVIAALALTVEARDPYTAGHQRRVGELAAAMALHMGFGKERAEGLRVAGMLHDVGKINIPAEILSKPGLLSTIEFELIKGHAEAGYDILAAIHFPWPVAEMARQHHERQDGSGYPAGLAGEDILPEARILAVADVVEAMASHRPYRPALGLEAALAEVRGGAGVRYDDAAVAACEQVFAEGFAFSEA